MFGRRNGDSKFNVYSIDAATTTQFMRDDVLVAASASTVHDIQCARLRDQGIEIDQHLLSANTTVIRLYDQRWQ